MMCISESRKQILFVYEKKKKLEDIKNLKTKKKGKLYHARKIL